MQPMAQTLEAEEDRSSPEPSVSSRGRVLAHWPLGLGLAAASAIALISKAALFPLFSGDSDESAYVYQARMLAQGHVTLSSRVHAEFFYPWLFGERNGRIFSQYQPGWPAVIAVGHVLGNEKISLVIVAMSLVLAIWFLAREIEPGSAPYAVGIFLLSPIFIIHSGLYLSYLWATALLAGGAAGVLAGLRTRRAWPYVVAGACFGWAQLTRPVDALIVMVLLGVFVALRLRKEGHVLRRALFWLAVGLLPFLWVTIVYNTHLTGSPLRFPITAVEPLDKFGFGPRRAAPDTAPLDYTQDKAFEALSNNAGSVYRWLAGGGVGLALAAGAVILRGRRSETWLFVVIGLAFPAVYFFWWGTALSATGSRNGLGPHYWVPAFAFLAVLAGWTLHYLARRSSLLAALVAIGLVYGTFTTTPGMFDNAHFTDGLSRGKLHGVMVAGKLHNAVVVMRADPRRQTHLDYQFLVGDPELKDDVLYAADRGPRESDLAGQFPTRQLYQWIQRTEPGHPLFQPSYVMEPLQVKTGDTVTLGFDITGDGPPVMMGYVSVDGVVLGKQTLDTAARRGTTHHFEVVLVAPGTPPPAPRPGTLVVAVGHDGVVQVGAAFGRDDDLGHSDLWERRFFVATYPGRVAVQTPGLNFHVLRFNGEQWLAQNVEKHLVETG
jgi:hypothetical protein